MSGWVKIHRSIVNWEWYDDTPTFRLFLHLILKANHKDKRYRGKVIKRGSLLTGREVLASQTGLSVSQIRTSLKKLELTNEIAIKSSPQGTEIQVVKYDDYQLITSKTSNEQPVNSQLIATNKNVKNEKKRKEIPPLEEFMLYGLEKSPEVSVDHLRSKYESWVSNDWRDGYNKPIKRWKSKLNATLPYLPKQPKKVRDLDQEYYDNVMKQVNANK